MKKSLVLSFAFLFGFIATAISQTDAQPKAKTTKDKSEQVRHAEEKSQGAAHSGQGRGGDKDMVEKEAKDNGKHKGHYKEKKHKKGKKAKKAKKTHHKHHDHDDMENERDGDKARDKSMKPEKDGEKPAETPKSRKTGGKNDKEAIPNPTQRPGSRQ